MAGWIVGKPEIILDQGMTMVPIYVKVSEHVTLKITKFASQTNNNAPVLVFPGWVTLLEKYFPIIKGLVQSGHPVYYVDTREKKSSIFRPPHHTPHDFSFDHYNEDTKQIVIQLGLVAKEFCILGGSFGAGLVTKYLASGVDPQYLPQRVVMIIPATNLYFIGWQKVLIRIPLVFEKIIIAIVEWYIRNNFHNPEEPELAYQFQPQIYEFNFAKIQHSAIAIDRVHGMRLKEDVRRVNQPTLVVGADNDFMHRERDTYNFSQLLPAGRYINLVSNHYTHSEMLGKIASRYFREQEFDDILPDKFR